MQRLLLPLALVTGLVCSACPEPRPPPLEPIRIGVLSPQSGALRDLAPSWESAALLAAEHVNASGGLLDGRPLELVVRDTQTSADAAVAAARALVEEGVVAFVGPASSGESKAVLDEVAADNAIPMVSCCATAASLTGGNSPNNGFFFRTTPSDTLQGKAMAFLANAGFTGAQLTVPACAQTVFVHRNDAYGAGFLEAFEDEYNGDISLLVPYGSANAEADRDALERAADQVVAHFRDTVPGGDEVCVVVISYVDDGGRIIARADGGLQDLLAQGPASFSYHFIVGDGANSGAFAAAVARAAPRIVGTVPFRALDDDAAWVHFRTAWRARFPEAGEPVPFTAQSFDAVISLALAVTQARALDPRKIRDNLFTVAKDGTVFKGRAYGEVAAAIQRGEDVDYDGPSGTVAFDAFGDVVGDYVLWQVEGTAAGAVVVEREPLPARVYLGE